MHYVYILECCDHTYYTGYTNSLDKRIAAHNAKKGAKYTRGRTPVSLVYYETFEDKREALRREYAIKQMKRKEKTELISGRKDEVNERQC